MKTTLIFTASGDTFLNVSYKEGEVTQKEIRLQTTLCYAFMIGTEETGYTVRFQIPYFRKFNKGGFISKQSALNYEQDILDEYFEDFVSGDPAELYESKSA